MKISAFAFALAAAPAAFPGLSVAAFGPAPADRSAASMIRSSTTNPRSSSSLLVATTPPSISTSTTTVRPLIVVEDDKEDDAIVEPSVVREASLEPLVIDDSFFDNLPFGVKITGADKLRAEGLTGKGVRVAVIDSGVDARHSGFHGQIKQQLWFRHGTPLSEGDHGTHVAGTIHMMAPEAEIYDYRVFGAEGWGVDSAVATSIEWAVRDGCDIINMSLGGPRASMRIGDAVRYAHSKGVHMIVAAGNEGDANPLTNELRYVPMFFFYYISALHGLLKLHHRFILVPTAILA
jgi:subtilisin family serine protease